MQHHLDKKSLNPLPLALAFSASFSRAPFSRLFPASTSQRDPGEPPNTARGPTHPSRLGNTSCKQISKFTLIGSAGNGNKFANNCSVRSINCLCSKRLDCKAGRMMQIEVLQDSCLLAPLSGVHWAFGYCIALNLL